MEALARPMNAPVRNMEVFDRYLAEEAALRLPEVDLQVRARFHRVVRQSALAWKRHPKAAFRILRSRHTLALAFEGPVEGKVMTLFTFRSACEFGDYRFVGFSPSSYPAGISPAMRGNLQRLKELYEAALPQAFHHDEAVAVVIKKTPSIDFLPIVDEARRVLDEGNQDFPPIDMRELLVVPAEHAQMFVGKTTVVPMVRPKPEPVAPSPPKAATNGATPHGPGPVKKVEQKTAPSPAAKRPLPPPPPIVKSKAPAKLKVEARPSAPAKAPAKVDVRPKPKLKTKVASNGKRSPPPKKKKR